MTGYYWKSHRVTCSGRYDRVLLGVTSCNNEVLMTGYCWELHRVTCSRRYDRVLLRVTSCNMFR